MKNKKRFVKLVTVMFTIEMIVGGLLLLDNVDGLNLSTQNVEAAETVASGGGYNYEWVLSSNGTLTISGTGEAYDDYYLWLYSRYHDGVGRWDDYKNSIKSVVIENGITGIAGGAFSDCYNLTSVEIPITVTWIGNSAFENCTSLTSIDIPNDETTIGSYAFSGCSSLKSIELPYGETEIASYAFYNCSSLSSVTIFDNVTRIGEYAFYGCSNLTDIELPDSVVNINGYAFYGCSGLTS